MIARELTKRHEEFLRGTLGELRTRIAAMAAVRGEITVLVAGATAEPAVDQDDVDAQIRAGRAAGRSLSDVASEIARRTGRPRREVYQRALVLEGR